MARKTRQRISYVLPLPNATAGHRLGVNGLAIDQDRSILYSGGRDGVIYAWNLGGSQHGSRNPYGAALSKTSYRQHTQAHSHWINDLILAHDNTALVSASSDISIKVWRPLAEGSSPPQTIGIHDDYVKCLATPGRHSSWIAAGGLDRKICLWDLGGNGKTLELDVADEESASKGSVYALAANDSMIASGGPESVVKVWDPRSGKRITRFVGHTDNIRSVLLSQDGGTIMTASADQTIKIWSTVAGRCQSTLTMHSDSVWCLYSDHPQLSVFYSGDRSGYVAKTDVRGTSEWEDGLSVAVCQEQEGINRLSCVRDFIWTATSSSSINRWTDVDTTQAVQSMSARWSTSSRAKGAMHSQSGPPPAVKSIPLSCVLRLSPNAAFPPLHLRDTERSSAHQLPSLRKGSTLFAHVETVSFATLRNLPEETIEGQNGLIKHVLLNDRRRVLTVDTAGEVLMWDLLKCIPIKSFGNRHIDDVVPEVNMIDNTAQWCNVDTRTGTLTCVLEENHCFDAEVYADELPEANTMEFKEDQRINLGKWVLRYLFATLLDEEVRRDELVRTSLMEKGQQRQEDRPAPLPMSIQLPHVAFHHDHVNNSEVATTPRPARSKHPLLSTPGLFIGLATPGGALSSPTASASGPASPGLGALHNAERMTPGTTLAKTPLDKYGDYFSVKPLPSSTETSGTGKVAVTPAELDDEGAMSPTELDRNGNVKANAASLGKRLRISFTAKKLGRAQIVESVKPPPVEEKAEDSDSRSSKTDEKSFDDNFLGTLQRIRTEYEEQIAHSDEPLSSLITPSPAQETPFLRPPTATTIIIQEDRPDVAGVSDLFEGSLADLGKQADLIEKVAPLWLGDVLLRNRIPAKEIVKVSFILEPHQKLLPAVTSNDGTERLNANRMLRVRKILAYIAERLETSSADGCLKPEESLELYCQNQLIPPKTTLAAIRTHMWRGGGDVVLTYKSVDHDALVLKRPQGPQSATAVVHNRSGNGTDKASE